MKKFIFGIFIILLLAVSTSASAGYPDRNGTVAYWTFDEGSGNIYGAVWADGKVGKALVYDGTSDYVSISGGSVFSNTKEFTVEFWARWDSFNFWSRIIDFGSSTGSNGAVVIANEANNDNFVLDSVHFYINDSMPAKRIIP